MNVERHPSLDDRFDPAIRIVDHDPKWGERAEAELRRVEQALGPLATRTEHVGSTAVAGLAAKPILDLQVSMAAIGPRAAYVESLERLGYLFVPDPDSADLHPVRQARPGDPGPITCMSAAPAAITSFGTWPCAISCVPTTKRRRGMKRSSASS